MFVLDRHSQIEEEKGESDEGPSTQSTYPEVKSSDPFDVTPKSSAPDESVKTNERAKGSENHALNRWTDDFLASHSGITFGSFGSEGEEEKKEEDRGDAAYGEIRNEGQNNLAVRAKGKTVLTLPNMISPDDLVRSCRTSNLNWPNLAYLDLT